MDIFSAIIFGFIQGITEFVPVSSTGHLVLARSLFNIQATESLAFDAFLSLATVASIVIYYFDELNELARALFRRLGRLPVNEKDILFIRVLAVGAVPGIIFGVLFGSFMDNAFKNPILVALVLIAGSVFFGIAEYRYEKNSRKRGIDTVTGLKVGFFQLLGLIPGFSRTGSSIAGAMLLGLSRVEATRFSFLLSLPVILGIGVKKVLVVITAHESIAWFPVVIGAITACIFGIITIQFMVSFMKKHTLWTFVWYRIILAGFVLSVMFMS